jgi:signal peptidase II
MVLKKNYSKNKDNLRMNNIASRNVRKKEFKSKNVKIKGYITIIFFLILIFIDRLTKIWAMNLKDSIDYGIIAFTYVTNTGAGFSILQNMNTLLIGISVLVLGLLLYFHDHINNTSVLLISSGIVGNVVDRIFYGKVIDFIDFKFWPIFNISDSLIFVGVLIWIVIIFRDNKKK